MVVDIVCALEPEPIVADTCCPLGKSKKTITAKVIILGKLGKIKLATVIFPRCDNVFSKKSIVKNRTHKASTTADKFAIITANCVIIIVKNLSTLSPISSEIKPILTASSGSLGAGGVVLPVPPVPPVPPPVPPVPPPVPPVPPVVGTEYEYLFIKKNKSIRKPINRTFLTLSFLKNALTLFQKLL